jgi:hypothetical protein
MVFLDIDSNATDGWYYPRIVLQDYQGNTSSGTAYGEFPIHDIVKMTVDTGSESGTVQATIIYEEY